MSAYTRRLWLVLSLALIVVGLPSVGAHAADAVATTVSVIADKGRADRSLAAGSLYRAGPDRVTVETTYEGGILLRAYHGTTGYDGDLFSIQPPRDKTLQEGTYTDAAADYPTADKARFYVSNSPCPSDARTTFTISDLAPDRSRFAVRYETTCTQQTGGVFGEIRVNQPADPDLVLSASRLAWPVRLVTQSRTAVPVMLANPGSDPVSITGLAVSGADADQFFTEPPGSCTQIAAGASCLVTVGFRPTRAGDAEATLTVDGTGGTYPLALAGTGVLGTTTVSVAGDWQNRTVYKPGSFWDGHDNITVSQADGRVSARAARPGASSGVELSFQAPPGEPLRVGHYAVVQAYNAPPGPTLSVCESGGCGTQYGEFDILDLAPDRVWLTFRASSSPQAGPSVFGEVRFGQPVADNVLTIPTRMPWSPQPLGETNDPVPITLVNLGEQELRVSGIRATGTDAGDFTVAPVGTCASVASGGDCSVGVTFEPDALGARAAALEVSDSRGGRTIALTGSGRPAPELKSEVQPSNNHFPTCGFQAVPTGSDSLAFSWDVECDPRQGEFPGHGQIHYLIRGALGTTAPRVQADGFAVYSGHGHDASVAKLEPGKAYAFTLFTQHYPGETAVAFTTTPAAVSLAASLAKPVKGAELLLTGAVTAGESGVVNQPVELRAVYAGTSKPVTVATSTTDSTAGRFEFRIVPTRSATYFVTYEGRRGGSYYTSGGARSVGGPIGPATSAQRPVPLAVKVSLRAPAGTVKYGKAVTVTASLAPVQAKTSAQLQVYVNKKWKTVGTARCDAKGALSFAVKLKDKETYSYRVWWPGNAVTVAGASNSVKIKVK